MPEQSSEHAHHDLQVLRRRVRRQQSLFEAQERKRVEEERRLIQEYEDYLREKKLRQQQERQQRLAAHGRALAAAAARREAAAAKEAKELSEAPSSLHKAGSPCSNSAPEVPEEPKQKDTKVQIDESFVPAKSHSEIPENVAKLYRKFRGPLMLKYLKELAANDQVSVWRLDEVLSVQPSKVEAESEKPEKETKRCWTHQARKQRLRMMHQVAAEVLSAKRELGHCFAEADHPLRIAA